MPPGHPPAPPKCGLGSKTAPRVKPDPAKVWSREQNRGPRSTPAPPKCGLGSKTVPLGQARPRPSMVLAPEIQKGVKNKHMKDGFIKVAVTAPDSKVADCAYNIEK